MIALLALPGGYAADALVAAGGLKLHAVDSAALGLPAFPCPYHLPAISTGDTVLVVSSWLRQLEASKNAGDDLVQRALSTLRERFTRVIGLDQSDPFALGVSEAEAEQMDAILKVNGVYHDHELYNFVAGAETSAGRWIEKTEARTQAYSAATFDKIHLSVPCFLGICPTLRARTRGFYGQPLPLRLARNAADALFDSLPNTLKSTSAPRDTVHFFGSLTHIQRRAAVRLLRDSTLRWSGGITGVPQYISGWNGADIARLEAAERAALVAQLEAEQLMARPLNRFRYQSSMLNSKAVLSIAGYGEICFRMAEAWAARRVLVCQEMSHARTLFPLEAGRNVVYCKPDLSDLLDILEDIEVNFKRYIPVAEQGFADWQTWSGRYQDVVRAGFAPLYAESSGAESTAAI